MRPPPQQTGRPAEAPPTYSIEMPFPDDLAPYKIVRRGATGKRRIVDSALTEADAKRLKREWEQHKPRWWWR